MCVCVYLFKFYKTIVLYIDIPNVIILNRFRIIIYNTYRYIINIHHQINKL